MRLSALLASLIALPGWGAALTWTQGEGYRSAAVTPEKPGKPGFTSMDPSKTAINFSNALSDETVAKNQIYLLGSGVALGDVDGDGGCDIYFCRLEGPNALYRNLGDWQFQDVTASAGVGCPDQFSTAAVLADLDADGDLDLLVNGIGAGTRCFLNDGHGHFSKNLECGLVRKFGSTSLALADVDNDGDLDVYVANYRTTTIRSTGMQVMIVNGRRVLRPEDREFYEFTRDGMLLEHGEPDYLYLNDGKAHFSVLSWGEGHFRDEEGKRVTAAPKDWSLSVMFRDINGDGAPDLYICNDFWSPDRIWLNDGRGDFNALPRLAMRDMSTFSMGVDFADLNRDGHDEFMVLDMLSREHSRRMRQKAMAGQNFNNSGRIDDRPQVDRNTLFLNRGDGTYADIAQFSGLQASEWSWGVVFLDVDLDGYEDVLITNGHGFDTQDSDTEKKTVARGKTDKPGGNILLYPRLRVPNVAFRNRGDLTFEESGAAWGFNQTGVSHGIATADLDNDGDLDVVVNNLNAPAGIYRNNAIAPRVTVRLKSKYGNTQGIGAKVRVTGGSVAQSQEVISGGRYLSGDDPIRMFAAAKPVDISVKWRNGKQSVIRAAEPNRIYEIVEPAAAGAPIPKRALHPVPLFKDVSDAIGHRHIENAFNDFARQPLLSRKLSQAGPGLGWCDADGDGAEDLFIGTGAGGEIAIFRNETNKFRREALFAKADSDQDCVLAIANGAGALIFSTRSNYESGDTNIAPVKIWRPKDGKLALQQQLPATQESVGPLALADVDGDGDLDLFAGGRVVPGHYPSPATSRLFRNDNGQFVLAEEWPQLGLVSGAVFSDLTGDGLPELVLAREWDSIAVFENHRGKLVNATGRFGLAQYTGFWNGVTVGDFDGDGRLDIAASNWGRNTPYQTFIKDEWRAWYGPSGEFLEAYIDRGRTVPAQDLNVLAVAFPSVLERFATSAAYSQASLDEVLGPQKAALREVRVRWLDSTVFLNRGGHFEAKPLPFEAQLAPAFGMVVADADNDGAEDLFLAQNFFAVNEQTSRYDAGRGLWLKGDGHGNFRALDAQESGVAIYGEQRGAALCDFNADGKIDLAVAQNAAETKLFQNATPNRGLRVRLPPSRTIGAILQVVYADGMGPAREIHAGSGYLSQDSAVQVLGLTGTPKALHVRWPGGTESTLSLTNASLEVVVSAP